MFRTAWEAGTVVVPAPPVRWQGQEQSSPPDRSAQAFARIKMDHVQRTQGSLSNESGQRKWLNEGIIMIQCFGSVSTGRGLGIAESLAILAKNAFEGKTSPGGIWFRKCRTNEVGSEDGWFQVNAVAEFSYDEVR